jgi:hypothetical protein
VLTQIAVQSGRSGAQLHCQRPFAETNFDLLDQSLKNCRDILIAKVIVAAENSLHGGSGFGFGGITMRFGPIDLRVSVARCLTIRRFRSFFTMLSFEPSEVNRAKSIPYRAPRRYRKIVDDLPISVEMVSQDGERLPK